MNAESCCYLCPPSDCNQYLCRGCDEIKYQPEYDSSIFTTECSDEHMYDDYCRACSFIDDEAEEASDDETEDEEDEYESDGDADDEYDDDEEYTTPPAFEWSTPETKHKAKRRRLEL